MSLIRTLLGVAIGIFVVHILQFAAIETMASSVPIFLEQTTANGPFSVHQRIKSIRNIVVLWVPLVADVGLLTIAAVSIYRKQRITAQQQVGPLR
jgi:hypothetical protein